MIPRHFLTYNPVRLVCMGSHAAGADHALFAFPPERCLQQFGSIDLDFDIFEIMLHIVAFAPAVAVNAAVRAPPVYIHPVL